MGIGELFLLAVGLSMDAFAVSVCKGLAMKKATPKAGGDLRPLVRRLPDTDARRRLFSLARCLPKPLKRSTTGSPFGLLVIIGINMLKEVLEKEDESGDDPEKDADLSVKTMFLMAVATSIDALAVGISLPWSAA